MNCNTEHFPAHPSKANRNYLELANFSSGVAGPGARAGWGRGWKPGNSVEHTEEALGSQPVCSLAKPLIPSSLVCVGIGLRGREGRINLRPSGPH